MNPADRRYFEVIHTATINKFTVLDGQDGPHYLSRQSYPSSYHGESGFTHSVEEIIMKRLTLLIFLLFIVPPFSGCGLKEIRSKTKFGPEFRHRGIDSTNSVRWYAQQGFDFKWENDLTTGITYRRRDTDNGSGDNDNGVWIDFSFPIWKAPKKSDQTSESVHKLEKRITELEALYDTYLAKQIKDSSSGDEPIKIAEHALTITRTHQP